MTSRRDLDRAFSRDPVLGSEPRASHTFLYNRLGFHPDRVNPKNLPMEARVWAKSLLRNDTPKPFVIYGRPRSGTTLLVRLLDQIPNVRCDGELLHYFLLDPVGLLARLPRRAGPDVKAYGVKLISYHLMDVQKIHRPLTFFDRIAAHGYSVIHLTRSTWDQTVSLAKAHLSGVYFEKTDTARTLRLDPDRILDMLRWNEAVLAYEHKVMAHVPHTTVHYDTDLKSSGQHQKTIDGLCHDLGVDSAPVTAMIRRTGGKEGLHRVENLEEVAARVRDSDLAHLVPETL